MALIGLTLKVVAQKSHFKVQKIWVQYSVQNAAVLYRNRHSYLRSSGPSLAEEESKNKFLPLVLVWHLKMVCTRIKTVFVVKDTSDLRVGSLHVDTVTHSAVYLAHVVAMHVAKSLHSIYSMTGLRYTCYIAATVNLWLYLHLCI